MRLLTRHAVLVTVLVMSIGGFGTRAEAARGGTARPFTLTGVVLGSLQSDCTAPGTSTCTLAATGTMQGAHVGRAAVAESAVIHFDQVTSVDPLCFHADVHLRVTAGNGDLLQLDGAGTTCPGLGTADATYSVVGGTGRFADATGSGTDSATTPDGGQHLYEVRTGTISY